jgi:hypothetical protein
LRFGMYFSPKLNANRRAGLGRRGDRLERDALSSLFDAGIDPMVVIRWKDIYERLEEAIDACSSSWMARRWGRRSCRRRREPSAAASSRPARLSTPASAMACSVAASIR